LVGDDVRLTVDRLTGSSRTPIASDHSEVEEGFFTHDSSCFCQLLVGEHPRVDDFACQDVGRLLSIETQTQTSLGLPLFHILGQACPSVLWFTEHAKRIVVAVRVPDSDHLEVRVTRKVGLGSGDQRLRKLWQLIGNQEHSIGFEPDQLANGFFFLGFLTSYQR